VKERFNMATAATAPAWVVPAAGLISGTSQVLAEQPLDTIKTRLQSMRFSQSAKPHELLSLTLRAEGGRALLNGITPRLLTYPLVKLSLFSLFEYTYSQTQSTALAGACAGAVNTVVACPADVFKSQLQITRFTPGSPPPSKVALDLFRTNGVNVLYRGWGALVVRDAIGYSILYSVYFRGQQLRGQHQWVGNALPGWALGGLAGACFYGATLPIDRLKVMMQTQPGGRAGSLRACFRAMYERGPSAFYRGAGPTLARTFVGQAVGLTVYEYACRAGGARQ
jgi:hypothetical protein